MSLLDRTSRVVRANINASKGAYEAADDAQGILRRMRQAVALAVHARQQVQIQASKDKAAIALWQRRAQLAMDKEREDLARQALTLKREHTLSLRRLEKQVEEQSIHLRRLQLQLVHMETVVTKSRASTLQKSVGTLDASSAMSAFERMEDKILQMESSGQAADRFADADLDSQFMQFESGSDMDYELELTQIGIELSGSFPTQGALPLGEERSVEIKDEAVDAELEALKNELDNL